METSNKIAWIIDSEHSDISLIGRIAKIYKIACLIKPWVHFKSDDYRISPVREDTNRGCGIARIYKIACLIKPFTRNC